MPLTPEWLALEQAQGGRTALGGTPTEIRQQYDALIEALLPFIPEPSPNVSAKDGDVEGVKYRVYTPVGASGPLPVGFWTHGGGYMLGDLNGDDVLCRAVSEHTQSVIVAVDYRLTPEHPWPAQLEDSLNVFRWAHQNAASINGDPNKFYAIGGSAGGGLAFQIANRLVAKPETRNALSGIAAFVPLTTHYDAVPSEYKSQYTSYDTVGTDSPVINKKSMQAFYEAAKVDPKDPEVFTINAVDNHKYFPPTYMVKCEYDPLRDDATIMEAALKKAGVPVKLDTYPGLPHYFWIMPQIPEGQKFAGNLFAGVEWLKSQFK